MLKAPHGAGSCLLMLPAAVFFIPLSSTVPRSQPVISGAGSEPRHVSAALPTVLWL